MLLLSGSRVAVLVAAHNRREFTRRALSAVLGSDGDFDLEIFCVDDGSTDGTGEMVRALVGGCGRVYRGDGCWFWSRAMAVAEAQVAKAGLFDYMLWLNDDTTVMPGTLARMLDTAREYGNRCAVVGTVVDPESQDVLYGGVRVLGPGILRQRTVPPSDFPVIVDTFHGNLVLIPISVSEAIGPIDGEFEHAGADIDYGLRLRARGIPVVVAPGIAAAGVANDVRIRESARWPSPRHFRHQLSRKVLPPRSIKRLLKRHAGRSWPLYFLYVYARTILPS